MTAISRVAAHAKLNLGLRIVGRRADGYHLLESLFVPIELADTLSFAFGTVAGVRLEVERAPSLSDAGALPAASENLAARAALRFYEVAGLEASLEIRLHKAIPVAAGLGGGSSDAGCVLRVLADHHAGALSHAALLEIAAELGADVPFFLCPEPSMVRGIGDRVEAIPGFPRLALVLANPGQSLATAEVFADFARRDAALTLASSRPTMPALEGPLTVENAAAALASAFDSDWLTNDLEPAASRLCPVIADLKQKLGAAGARWTGMSGSGATVYGIFEDDDTARDALERLAFAGPIWACVSRTASRMRNSRQGNRESIATGGQ